MRGRKPKPTHLKLVMGNPGGRPLNENEPQFELAIPSPPPFLNDYAKVEWGRVSEILYNVGMLTKIDRAILAAYCQAYGRWEQAERELAALAEKSGTSGLLQKTKNGNFQQSVLVGIANRAMTDCARYAVELGMTPSARSRINVERVNKRQPTQEKKRSYFA